MKSALFIRGKKSLLPPLNHRHSTNLIYTLINYNHKKSNSA